LINLTFFKRLKEEELNRAQQNHLGSLSHSKPQKDLASMVSFFINRVPVSDEIRDALKGLKELLYRHNNDEGRFTLRWMHKAAYVRKQIVRAKKNYTIIKDVLCTILRNNHKCIRRYI